MSTLQELDQELREAEQEVAASGGEITPRYEQAALALLAKVDRFALYCADQEGRAAALRAFAAKIIQKAKAAENARQRLLDYADTVMGDRDSLDGEHVSLVRRKNPGSVRVTDEDALRLSLPECVSTTYVTTVDKKAVGKAIREGREVHGAVLVPSHRIEIK
jgi:hypothetical protein